MNKWARMIHTSTVLAIVCCMTGCQSFHERVPKVNMEKLAFWKKKEITDGSNAQKMIALWSENVAYGAQLGAKRGLGGRLYFYDVENKPTKIEGDLVIYAYDDDADPTGAEPARKYTFSGEEFASFYSESEFGPSYSVWLPWDDVGNPKQEISLVPIFKTASGNILRGELSRSLLPGKNNNLRSQTTTGELARNRQKEKSEIRRVSYSEETESDVTRKGIRRMSIRMPEVMKQRLVQEAQQTGNHGPKFQPLTGGKQTSNDELPASKKVSESKQVQTNVLPKGTAASRMAQLYQESKLRANADNPRTRANQFDANVSGPTNGQFLGSQRPVRLQSE